MTELRTKLLEALLVCLEKSPWDAVSFEQLHAETGVPLVEIAQLYPDKCALLRDFMAEMDQKMLTLYRENAVEGPPQERLFEIMMCRIDVMTARKAAYRNLFVGAARDPLCAPTMLCARQVASLVMLEEAGYSPGLVRETLFSALSLQVLLTWLSDETEDMAKTLAAVDTALGRFSHWAA